MKKACRAGGVLVALLVLLLAGCAQTEEQKAQLAEVRQVKPDATLFRVEPVAPERRLPLRLALLVSPSVPGAKTSLPLGPGSWVVRKNVQPLSWQVQVASVVEAALAKSIGEATQAEVRSVSAMPRPGDGFDATLEVVSVRFDYDERLLWLVPIPIPIVGFVAGNFEASMRLAVQLRLVDAQGQQVWTKYYDDGVQRAEWQFPSDDRWLPGVQRVVHEAAWRLAQQALQDLRDWQAAERVRPRAL